MNRTDSYKTLFFITGILIITLILTVSFPKPSVTKLKKDSLSTHEVGKLKHFYEPKPDSPQLIYTLPDWLGYTPDNTINSDSLNEIREYSANKPSKTYRILTIGDSFTFGLFVDTKDNFSEKLEEFLNLKCKNSGNTEVINLGVPGYDITYTVERFMRRGIKYNPDLVIWLVHTGNFLKIQDFVMDRAQKYITDPDQGADRARKEILEELGEDKIAEYSMRSINFLGKNYKEKLLLISPRGMLTGKTREKTESFVQNRNNSAFYEIPLNLSKENGVFQDGHFNKKGHLLVAQELYSYLINERLVSCD